MSFQEDVLNLKTPCLDIFLSAKKMHFLHQALAEVIFDVQHL